MRLVIVEDSAEIVQRYREHFAGISGLELVGVLRTVADAVRAIPTLQPDTLLLDYNLPDGNCLEIMKQLRAFLSGVTLIVASGHPSMHQREHCVAAGAMSYFDKSNEYSDLIATLAFLAQLPGAHPSASAKGMHE